MKSRYARVANDRQKFQLVIDDWERAALEEIKEREGHKSLSDVWHAALEYYCPVDILEKVRPDIHSDAP